MIKELIRRALVLMWTFAALLICVVIVEVRGIGDTIFAVTAVYALATAVQYLLTGTTNPARIFKQKD